MNEWMNDILSIINGYAAKKYEQCVRLPFSE